MQVFVTGGTGFIGSRVVRRLVARGHRVRCLIHRPEHAASLAGVDFEPVRAELGDRAALCPALVGCDALVHLAALYEFWTAHPDDYRRVNVEGTRAVLECALAARVGKVVHVSSLVVYGHPEAEPANEETPAGGELFSRYAETKSAGDRVAWELYRDHGLPLVVVYPGGVLGERDPKPSGDYVRGMAERRLPARLLESAVFPWVYVEDAAEIVVRAAEQEGNVGERYFAVGENATFGELNRWIAEASGRRLPRLRMPDPVVAPTAAVLTGIAYLTRHPPLWGMAFDQIRTMRHGARFDGSKAAREFGVHYTPIRQAVAQAVTAT